jgi:antitoxin ParD1/3/4
MKIVTVNIPEPYINAIDKLTGHEGLYPSRSELIRVAVRDFLLRELRMASNLSFYQKKTTKDEFDHNNFVRVPMADDMDFGPEGAFKTFRIVRK